MLVPNRDINAAVNLLKLHTGSSPGIYACGEASSGEGQKLSNLSFGFDFLGVVADCEEIFLYFGPSNSWKHLWMDQNMGKLPARCNKSQRNEPKTQVIICVSNFQLYRISFFDQQAHRMQKLVQYTAFHH